MAMSKEERANYDKAYRKAHKAKIAAYRDSHKVERVAYDKAYLQTPSGKKSHKISDWKRYGLIHDDYNTLYESYLQATNCDVCKNEYKDTFDRCMDHDHETGQFRQFLCRSCNNMDHWKTLN